MLANVLLLGFEVVNAKLSLIEAGGIQCPSKFDTIYSVKYYINKQNLFNFFPLFFNFSR